MELSRDWDRLTSTRSQRLETTLYMVRWYDDMLGCSPDQGWSRCKIFQSIFVLKFCLMNSVPWEMVAFRSIEPEHSNQERLHFDIWNWNTGMQINAAHQSIKNTSKRVIDSKTYASTTRVGTTFVIGPWCVVNPTPSSKTSHAKNTRDSQNSVNQRHTWLWLWFEGQNQRSKPVASPKLLKAFQCHLRKGFFLLSLHEPKRITMGLRASCPAAGLPKRGQIVYKKSNLFYFSSNSEGGATRLCQRVWWHMCLAFNRIWFSGSLHIEKGKCSPLSRWCYSREAVANSC